MSAKSQDEWCDDVAWLYGGTGLVQLVSANSGRRPGLRRERTFDLVLWKPRLTRKRPPHIRITAWRSIFPVPVFGSSSMNFTSRGYLYGSSFVFT